VKCRDQDGVADIAEAAQAFELYLSRGTLDIEETYYACRARLVETGEAAANLSSALTSANWQIIHGMRVVSRPSFAPHPQVQLLAIRSSILNNDLTLKRALV